MPLTEAAVISLAIACAPGLDPTMIVGIGKHQERPRSDANIAAKPERVSRLRSDADQRQEFPMARSHRADSARSLSVLAAAARLLHELLTVQHGSPTSGLRNGYVEAVLAQTDRIRRQAAGSVAEAGRAGGQTLSAQLSTFSSR